MLSQQRVKNLSTEDLRWIFRECQDSLNLKSEPRAHQYGSALWALERDRVIFLFGIGTGKTFASLLTNGLWRCEKTLIVCPNSVRQTWKEEIEKHTNFSYVELYAETKERKRLLKEVKVQFYLINYEGLKLVFGKKTDRKQGKKYIPDEEAIRNAGVDCLIIDEAHHTKWFWSLQSQIIYKLSKQADKCIMLTGTPVGADMSDFWSEFMVLDQGATFGTSWTTFMNKYFNRYQIKVKDRLINQWSVKKESKQEILELVGTKTIRYQTEECCDLPPVTYEKRFVNLSAEQMTIYSKILNDLRVELDDGKVTLTNIVNKSAKLAQVVSGFVKKGDDIVYLKTNPKLKELVDLMYEIEGKVIVFHHYVAEGRMIEKALRKKGFKCASMRGEIKDKDKQYTLFTKDPKCKVLVAHPLSGGEGLNLQVANVIVFFSQIGGGAITRPQSEGRIIRSGQEKPCVIVDLIALDNTRGESIDERMYKSSQSKRDFAKSLLDWLSDC